MQKPTTLAQAKSLLSRVKRDQQDLARAARPDAAPRGLAWGQGTAYKNRLAAAAAAGRNVTQAQAWMIELEAAEAQKAKATPAPVATKATEPAAPKLPKRQQRVVDLEAALAAEQDPKEQFVLRSRLAAAKLVAGQAPAQFVREPGVQLGKGVVRAPDNRFGPAAAAHYAHKRREAAAMSK